MRNEKKFSKRGTIISRNIFSDLRFIILMFFIIFFIIIIIYNVYFETPIEKKNDKTEDILEFSKTESISIFKEINNITNTTNTTTQLHNPSVVFNGENQYLLAFECVETNKPITIILMQSDSGISWTPLKNLDIDLNGTKNPRLKYIQDEDFMLFYELGENRYYRLSSDGSSWSSPKSWDYDLENKSIYNKENYILIANQTGLWFSKLGEKGEWDKFIELNFTNPAIAKISDYRFIIVHENPVDNFDSIILTTVYFKEPSDSESILKWELLILFIILGIILFGLMVHEVAQE